MSKTIHQISIASFLLLAASCTPMPQSALSRAAAAGDLTTLDQLLAAGQPASERQAALVWAARSGQPESIRHLAKSGVDLNATAGVNDWPVLMHAIHKNQSQSVTALLNAGANPDGHGPKGETALMMAAGYGYTDIVRILLSHKADAHASMNGANALDFALSGVADIDKFTLGKCQSETVHVLREIVPDLAPKDPGKLKSCT